MISTAVSSSITLFSDPSKLIGGAPEDGKDSRINSRSRGRAVEKNKSSGFGVVSEEKESMVNHHKNRSRDRIKNGRRNTNGMVSQNTVDSTGGTSVASNRRENSLLASIMN